MISTEHIWSFFFAAMAIIIAPGPSVLFAIARAISWGRRSAIITVAGNAVGMLVLAGFVAFGLGPILSTSEFLFFAVQLGGGLYLVWMGIDAVRHRVESAADMSETPTGRLSFRKNLREGFLVGFLNPKAIVFFAAIFPQFVDRELGSVTLQLLSLGAAFALMAFVSDGSWALAAGTARNWLSGEAHRLEKLRLIGGLVMMVLGVAIVLPLVLS